MERVWVVEILQVNAERLGWQPTVGVGLTRVYARREMTDWKRRNPDDRFRLWPYLREANRG